LFVGKCFFTVDIIIPLGALAPGHFSEVWQEIIINC
jgi:hypothetical protein